MSGVTGYDWLGVSVLAGVGSGKQGGERKPKGEVKEADYEGPLLKCSESRGGGGPSGDTAQEGPPVQTDLGRAAKNQQ